MIYSFSLLLKFLKSSLFKHRIFFLKIKIFLLEILKAIMFILFFKSELSITFGTLDNWLWANTGMIKYISSLQINITSLAFSYNKFKTQICLVTFQIFSFHFILALRAINHWFFALKSLMFVLEFSRNLLLTKVTCNLLLRTLMLLRFNVFIFYNFMA